MSWGLLGDKVCPELSGQCDAAGMEEEEEAPQRGSTVSYCKLDYPTLLEACQLRLHLLRARLRKHTQDRCLSLACSICHSAALVCT